MRGPATATSSRGSSSRRSARGASSPSPGRGGHPGSSPGATWWHGTKATRGESWPQRSPVRAGPSARRPEVKLALEIQTGPIEDETRARIAMVRPILRATLYALSLERVERLGGYAAVTLHDLAREWREGDGDWGICCEYAIHGAIERRDPLLVPRIGEVLERHCRIKGNARSILFGAEKGARLELLKTDRSLLTPQARLVVSERGRPVKLKTHLDRVKRA